MRRRAVPVHDFSLCAEYRARQKNGHRVCAHANCDRAAHHPTPMGRDPSVGAQWLCACHARERNVNWNYFQRMSGGEIDAARVAAHTWNRPTWPVGGGPSAARAAPQHRGPDCGGSKDARMRASGRSRSDLRALAILGLHAEATPGDIRDRFRRLLRNLHPDLNDGRHVDATRLRAIIWAWRVLRPAGAARTQ